MSITLKPIHLVLIVIGFAACWLLSAGREPAALAQTYTQAEGSADDCPYQLVVGVAPAPGDPSQYNRYYFTFNRATGELARIDHPECYPEEVPAGNYPPYAAVTNDKGQLYIVASDTGGVIALDTKNRINPVIYDFASQMDYFSRQPAGR